MKRFQFTFILAMVLMLFSSAFAQQSYSFRNVVFRDPNSSFTQLLGINNNNIIAGYHNFQQNQGFTLVLPNSFTSENYPNSMMTQVIGINNRGTTDGFYVDNAGLTHGFFRTSDGRFTKVDYPGSQIATEFNQLLSQNDNYQAAGYYSNSIGNTTPDIPYTYDEVGGVFHVITIPGAVGGAQATGINNSGVTCGFFIDANGVNHGWIIFGGVFMPLDVPGSTFTQALGLNNRGKVVGTFTDAAGQSHGFVYTIGTSNFVTVDAPNGVGSTIVNGINDAGKLVGFYGAAPINTGFVATPVAAASDAGSEEADVRSAHEDRSGVSPVAVDRELPPASSDGVIVEPPVQSPNAISREAGPTSRGAIVEPPVQAPTAVSREVSATAKDAIARPRPNAITLVSGTAHSGSATARDAITRPQPNATHGVSPTAIGPIVIDPVR
jgi:probable HAF family extracellular repeat protein